jgi:hypothetical protein
MVETIAPVVHGGRTLRYYTTVALHAVGALVAAAALGALLGGVGMMLGAPWDEAGPIAVAAVGALYALRELVRLPVPIPDRKAQVPDWWRTFYAPRVAALLYGLGLGAGFLTNLSFGTLVAVGALAVTSGDVLIGALLGAPFGLARGLSVLIARDDGAATVDRLMARAQTRAPEVVNGLALVALSGAALMAA